MFDLLTMDIKFRTYKYFKVIKNYDHNLMTFYSLKIC